MWVTDGWNLHLTPSDSEFVIAELESPGDYDGIVGAAVPTIPHAIITNFSPFWDHGRNPAPLIAAGWYCVTEAYIGDNPNATPDRLNGSAKNLGWSTSQPSFGVHNAPLSAYDQWSDWPGCDYLAEYIFHD